MPLADHVLLDSALAATALVAAGGTLTIAALTPQSQLFGRTLIAGTDPTEVALTYDDGPNDACTPALLDLLARYNAKATFFMVGGFVRQQAALARQVQAAGHLIGNHTMSHPWLAWQSSQRIREELRSCQQELEDALGAPVRYFRPPHGARRPYVLRVAEELELTTVQWNSMGKDWKLIPPAQIVANLDRGLSSARRQGRGGNILLHDGDYVRMGADRRATLAATETLLRRFAHDGTRVVTVDAWK